MFRCNLLITVCNRDGDMGTFQRTLQLPFVPFARLWLIGAFSDEMECHSIESVAWDVPGEYFDVWLYDLNLEYCSPPVSAPWTIEKALGFLGPAWTLADEQREA